MFSNKIMSFVAVVTSFVLGIVVCDFGYWLLVVPNPNQQPTLQQIRHEQNEKYEDFGYEPIESIRNI